MVLWSSRCLLNETQRKFLFHKYKVFPDFLSLEPKKQAVFSLQGKERTRQFLTIGLCFWITGIKPEKKITSFTNWNKFLYPLRMWAFSTRFRLYVWVNYNTSKNRNHLKSTPKVSFEAWIVLLLLRKRSDVFACYSSNGVLIFVLIFCFFYSNFLDFHPYPVWEGFWNQHWFQINTHEQLGALLLTLKTKFLGKVTEKLNLAICWNTRPHPGFLVFPKPQGMWCRIRHYLFKNY